MANDKVEPIEEKKNTTNNNNNTPQVDGGSSVTAAELKLNGSCEKIVNQIKQLATYANPVQNQTASPVQIQTASDIPEANISEARGVIDNIDGISLLDQLQRQQRLSKLEGLEELEKLVVPEKLDDLEKLAKEKGLFRIVHLISQQKAGKDQKELLPKLIQDILQELKDLKEQREQAPKFLKKYYQELKNSLDSLSLQAYVDLSEAKQPKKNPTLQRYKFNIPAYILFFKHIKDEADKYEEAVSKNKKYKKNYAKVIEYFLLIENFSDLEQILPTDIKLSGNEIPLRLKQEVFNELFEICFSEIIGSDTANSHKYIKILKHLLTVSVVSQGKQGKIEEVGKAIAKEAGEAKSFISKKMLGSGSDFDTVYNAGAANRYRLAIHYFHLLPAEEQAKYPVADLWLLRRFFTVASAEGDIYKDVVQEINKLILGKIKRAVENSQLDLLVYLIEKTNLLTSFGKNKELSIEILLTEVANLEKVQEEVAKLSIDHSNKTLFQFVAKYAKKVPANILNQLACYKAASEYNNPKVAQGIKAAKAVDSLLSSYLPIDLPANASADNTKQPKLSFEDFNAQKFFDIFSEDDRKVIFSKLSANLLERQKDRSCRLLLQQLWKSAYPIYLAYYIDKLIGNSQKTIDIIKTLKENGNIEALRFLISEYHNVLNGIIALSESKDETFLISWRRLWADFAPENLVTDAILIDITKDICAEIRTNKAAQRLVDLNKSIIKNYFNRIAKPEECVFSADDLETLSSCPELSKDSYEKILTKFNSTLVESLKKDPALIADIKFREKTERYLSVLKKYLEANSDLSDPARENIRAIYIKLCFSSWIYCGSLSKEHVKVEDLVKVEAPVEAENVKKSEDVKKPDDIKKPRDLKAKGIKKHDINGERLLSIARYILSNNDPEIIKNNLIKYYALLPSEPSMWHEVFTLCLIRAWEIKYRNNSKSQQLPEVKKLLGVLFANETFKVNANNPEFLEEFITLILPHIYADKSLVLWSNEKIGQDVFTQVVEQAEKLATNQELLVERKNNFSPNVVREIKKLATQEVNKSTESVNQPSKKIEELLLAKVEQLSLEKSKEILLKGLFLAIRNEIPKFLLKSYSPSDVSNYNSLADYCLGVFVQKGNQKINVELLVGLLNETSNNIEKYKSDFAYSIDNYKALLQRILVKLGTLFDFEQGSISQALINNVRYVVNMPELLITLLKGKDPKWFLLYIDHIGLIGDEALDKVSHVLLQLKPAMPHSRILQVAILLQRKSNLKLDQIAELGKAIDEESTLGMILENFTDTTLEKLFNLLTFEKRKVLFKKSMQAESNVLTEKNKQRLLATFISLEDVNSAQISEIGKDIDINSNIFQLLKDSEKLYFVDEKLLRKLLTLIDPPADLFNGLEVDLDSFNRAASVDQELLIPSKLSRAILSNQTYLAYIIDKVPENHNTVIGKLLNNGFSVNSRSSSNSVTSDQNLADIVNKCSDKDRFKILIQCIINLKMAQLNVDDATPGVIFSEEFLKHLTQDSLQRFLALCVPYLGSREKAKEFGLLEQPFNETLKYFINSADKKIWLLDSVEKVFNLTELADKNLQSSLNEYLTILRENGLVLYFSQKNKSLLPTGLVVPASKQTGAFWSLVKLLSGHLSEEGIKEIFDAGLLSSFLIKHIIDPKYFSEEKSVQAILYLINDLILASEYSYTNKYKEEAKLIYCLTLDLVIFAGKIANNEKTFESLIKFLDKYRSIYKDTNSDEYLDTHIIYESLISDWGKEHVEVAVGFFAKEKNASNFEMPAHFLARAIIESGNETLWEKNTPFLDLHSTKFLIDPTALDIYQLYALEEKLKKSTDSSVAITPLKLKLVPKARSEEQRQQLISKLKVLDPRYKMQVLSDRRDASSIQRLPIDYFEAIVSGLKEDQIKKLLASDDYGLYYTSEQCAIMIEQLPDTSRQPFFAEHIGKAEVGVLSAVFSSRFAKANQDVQAKLKVQASKRLAQYHIGSIGNFRYIEPEALKAVAALPDLTHIRMWQIYKNFDTETGQDRRSLFVDELYENNIEKSSNNGTNAMPPAMEFYKFALEGNEVLPSGQNKRAKVVEHAAKSGMTMQQFLKMVKEKEGIPADDILGFLSKYPSNTATELNRAQKTEQYKAELSLVAELVTVYYERDKAEKEKTKQGVGIPNIGINEPDQASNSKLCEHFNNAASGLIKEGIALKVFQDPILLASKNGDKQPYLEYLVKINDVSTQQSFEQIEKCFTQLKEQSEGTQSHTVQKVRDAQFQLADMIETVFKNDKDKKTKAKRDALITLSKKVKSEIKREKRKESSALWRFIYGDSEYVPSICKNKPISLPDIFASKNVDASKKANICLNNIKISKNTTHGANDIIIIKRKTGMFSSETIYLIKEPQQLAPSIISKTDYEKSFRTNSKVYEVKVLSKNVDNINIIFAGAGEPEYNVDLTRKIIEETPASKQRTHNNNRPSINSQFGTVLVPSGNGTISQQVPASASVPIPIPVSDAAAVKDVSSSETGGDSPKPSFSHQIN